MWTNEGFTNALSAVAVVMYKAFEFGGVKLGGTSAFEGAVVRDEASIASGAGVCTLDDTAREEVSIAGGTGVGLPSPNCSLGIGSRGK